MIRSAKLPDIPAIIAFLEQQFERTHYAREQAGKVDVVTAKMLLMNAIVADGVLRAGGCLSKIIERAGQISGFMLATLQPVYLIGNKLCVTNLFWIVDDQRSRGTDGPLLLVAMLHWAQQAGAIEAKCDTTAIISDPERAGKLLERMGFKLYGNLYRAQLAGVADERRSLSNR